MGNDKSIGKGKFKLTPELALQMSKLVTESGPLSDDDGALTPFQWQFMADKRSEPRRFETEEEEDLRRIRDINKALDFTKEYTTICLQPEAALRLGSHNLMIMNAQMVDSVKAYLEENFEKGTIDKHADVVKIFKNYILKSIKNTHKSEDHIPDIYKTPKREGNERFVRFSMAAHKELLKEQGKPQEEIEKATFQNLFGLDGGQPTQGKKSLFGHKGEAFTDKEMEDYFGISGANIQKVESQQIKIQPRPSQQGNQKQDFRIDLDEVPQADTSKSNTRVSFNNLFGNSDMTPKSPVGQKSPELSKAVRDTMSKLQKDFTDTKKKGHSSKHSQALSNNASQNVSQNYSQNAPYQQPYGGQQNGQKGQKQQQQQYQDQEYNPEDPENSYIQQGYGQTDPARASLQNLFVNNNNNMDDPNQMMNNQQQMYPGYMNDQYQGYDQQIEQKEKKKKSSKKKKNPTNQAIVDKLNQEQALQYANQYQQNPEEIPVVQTDLTSEKKKKKKKKKQAEDEQTQEYGYQNQDFNQQNQQQFQDQNQQQQYGYQGDGTATYMDPQFQDQIQQGEISQIEPNDDGDGFDTVNIDLNMDDLMQQSENIGEEDQQNQMQYYQQNIDPNTMQNYAQQFDPNNPQYDETQDPNNVSTKSGKKKTKKSKKSKKQQQEEEEYAQDPNQQPNYQDQGQNLQQQQYQGQDQQQYQFQDQNQQQYYDPNYQQHGQFDQNEMGQQQYSQEPPSSKKKKKKSKKEVNPEEMGYQGQEQYAAATQNQGYQDPSQQQYTQQGDSGNDSGNQAKKDGYASIYAKNKKLKQAAKTKYNQQQYETQLSGPDSDTSMVQKGMKGKKGGQFEKNPSPNKKKPVPSQQDKYPIRDSFNPNPSNQIRSTYGNVYATDLEDELENQDPVVADFDLAALGNMSDDGENDAQQYGQQQQYDQQYNQQYEEYGQNQGGQNYQQQPERDFKKKGGRSKNNRENQQGYDQQYGQQEQGGYYDQYGQWQDRGGQDYQQKKQKKIMMMQQQLQNYPHDQDFDQGQDPQVSYDPNTAFDFQKKEKKKAFNRPMSFNNKQGGYDEQDQDDLSQTGQQQQQYNPNYSQQQMYPGNQQQGQYQNVNQFAQQMGGQMQQNNQNINQYYNQQQFQNHQQQQFQNQQQPQYQQQYNQQGQQYIPYQEGGFDDPIPSELENAGPGYGNQGGQMMHPQYGDGQFHSQQQQFMNQNQSFISDNSQVGMQPGVDNPKVKFPLNYYGTSKVMQERFKQYYQQ